MILKFLVTTMLALSFSTAATAKPVKFTAQDSPPFNFMDGKEVKGASAAIMKAACAKLKWTCELEIVPQKRGLAMAEAGEIDGVWGLIQIAEREKYLTHSAQVWTSNLAYMGIKGVTATVAKPEDMKGFTISGVRASAAYKKAEELKTRVPDIKLIETNTYPEAFKSLFENTYGPKGVVVSYEDVGYYLAKQSKFDKLQTVVVQEQVQFKVGFSKKSDPKMVEDFNKTVEEMRKNGELKAALDPYGMKI